MAMNNQKYISLMSLDECVGSLEPSFSEEEKIDHSLEVAEITSKYTGLKKQVVELLLEGYSFFEIVTKTEQKKTVIYDIKKELMQDFQSLYHQQRNYRLNKEPAPLTIVLNPLKERVAQSTLQNFTEQFITEYSTALPQVPPAQLDTLDHLWRTNQAILTKIHDPVIKQFGFTMYLLKMLFQRKTALSIANLLPTKAEVKTYFRVFHSVIKSSPVLRHDFDLQASSVIDKFTFQFLDGTLVSFRPPTTEIAPKHSLSIIQSAEQSIITSEYKVLILE
jgi:hypothetical protein